VRIWGRQRLLVLARILPLAESFDVYLLGTGLPSFWVARMGEMRLTLGLSGWTKNDWTRGSAIDLLSPPHSPIATDIARVAEYLQDRRRATLEEIGRGSFLERGVAAACLNRLAHSGQVIRDLQEGVYRWRQVMPMALGEKEIGPPHPELAGSREILAKRKIQVEENREVSKGLQFHSAKVEGRPVELLLDRDGLIRRGKCNCSHHFKAGIRMGPCRHLLALRQVVLQGEMKEDTSGHGGSTESWFERLSRWSNI